MFPEGRLSAVRPILLTGILLVLLACATTLSRSVFSLCWISSGQQVEQRALKNKTETFFVALPSSAQLQPCQSRWHTDNFDIHAVTSTEEALHKWLSELHGNLEAFEDEFAAAAKTDGVDRQAIRLVVDPRYRRAHNISEKRKERIRHFRQRWFQNIWSKKFLPPEGPFCKYLDVLGADPAAHVVRDLR